MDQKIGGMVAPSIFKPFDAVHLLDGLTMGSTMGSTKTNSSNTIIHRPSSSHSVFGCVGKYPNGLSLPARTDSEQTVAIQPRRIARKSEIGARMLPPVARSGPSA